jgi:hypothetical protein
MKLCPQCEFIYEDDQGFCDMDGKELVKDSGPLAFAGTPLSPPPPIQPVAVPGVSLVVTGPALSELTPKSSTPRSFAVVALVGLVLIAVLLSFYYARLKPPAGHVAPAADQSRAWSNSAGPGASAPQAEVSPAAVAPEQLPDSSVAQTSAPLVLASESADRTALSARPVTAGGPAGSTKSSAIIWLKNGSTIRADEVWEKREGVWYRQAGLVTFLKRSEVQRIQRLNNLDKAEPRRRVLETTTTPPRAVAKTEPGDEKKESRVGSFLKKTGRFLKKPFKL